MKSREYGTWQPRNVFGPERQKLYDEHNRFLKKERAPQPKEYASAGIDEYYRVPEMKDMTGNPYEQNKDVLSGKSQKGTKNAGASRRQLMLRQVAGRRCNDVSGYGGAPAATAASGSAGCRAAERERAGAGRCSGDPFPELELERG